jgi:hypothetical protein
MTVETGAVESIPSRGGPWHSEPSLRAILLLWFVSFCLFVGFIAFLRNYFNLVDNFGDGSAYMSLASAIRHWNFRGVVIKQFWGLPYAMAALSRLTGASDRTAMLIISIVSSVAAAGIAYRLWGGGSPDFSRF